MMKLQTKARLLFPFCFSLAVACVEMRPDDGERQLVLAPVEAQHLQVKWCAKQKHIHWVFAFGETPDWTLNASPPEWQGHAGYSLPRAGGGRGSSHMSSQLQFTPHFWVYNEDAEIEYPPPFLGIRIALPGQQLVDAKFILGAPPKDATGKCVSIPVLDVKLAQASKTKKLNSTP